MEKIMIPLRDNDIAPRFDLATDVLIVTRLCKSEAADTVEEKVIVLDHASPETMCRLAISEKIQTVICAGIEKEYYDFLQWKGAKVLDNICGPVDSVLKSHLAEKLSSGKCFYPHHTA
jgi:predicted Fe-Mo cluster-binding NifX family protein